MRYLYYGLLQIAVDLALAMTALLVLLAGSDIPGRGFWRELSVGLGFAGLSMMGLQFFRNGRFQGITSPCGIDMVYHFHRVISPVAFTFLLLHPVILLLSVPATFSVLNPLSAPEWVTGGTIGLLAFALIVVSSLFRLKLKLNYEQWRLIHGSAAAAAVTWVMALLYIRFVKPLLMSRQPYTVEAIIIKEHSKCWSLVLRPEDHEGMQFMPGQFAWPTATGWWA